MRVVLAEGERPVLLNRLGLPDDASDEQIAAATTTLLLAEGDPAPAPDPDPEPDPAPDPDPDPAPAPDPDPDDDTDDEDTVTVDAAVFASMQRRLNLTARIEEEQRVEARDTAVEAAINDGRIPASRRDHYRERWDSDPVATERTLKKLRANTVPLTEIGSDATPEEDPAAYPEGWLPEVHRPVAASAAPAAQPTQVRQSRIMTEE